MASSDNPHRAERTFAIIGCMAVAFLLMALFIEGSSYIALTSYRRFHRDPLIPQNSPAYDNEKWGRDFWAEQTAFWAKAHSNYLPFTVWSVRKWHGKYINTDDSELGTWRRTTQAASPSCSKPNMKEVWVFGGSTVFGIGTPDWATIPSYLSREFNSDSSACVDVVNLGAEGYVTNQDLILLIQMLKAGRRPDIAIFYDGVNESLVGGYSPGIPTAHWNFETIKTKVERPDITRRDVLNLLYSSQLIKTFFSEHHEKNPITISDQELAARAEATLQNYEANLGLLQLLAKTYGFKAYCFWQPILAYGEKPLTHFEKDLKDARREEFEGRVYRGITAVYKQAEARSSSGNYVFLGHIFHNINDSIYVDEFHLDPRGNEIVAHAIAETVMHENAPDKPGHIQESKLLIP
jgi:hypothetical protein